MLDGLDDIDWARLSHAYGSAADVPAQIRALSSREVGVREKALHALYGNIYHQGTRYEASAYAVPFLLELLADPGTPDRAGIVGLLTALTVGYDSWWLPDNLPIAQHRAAAVGGEAVLATVPAPHDDSSLDDSTLEEGDEDEDEDYAFADLSDEDENKLYAYFFVQVYDAVRAGVPLLLDLLSDPDEELQTAAAYALAWFPEKSSTILPRLSASTFDSEITEATALISIGLLGGRPDPAHLHDPRPLVRWAAAVALRDQSELATWVTRDAATDERIPFLDGDLGGLAGLALGQLGADAAFDALLARIPLVTGVTALPPVAVALRLAFPDGPFPSGTEPATLNERQRSLVRALADSPRTWQYDGMTFGNFSEMVGAYGLPRSPEAMRIFLTPPNHP
ncbi:hypothetical protein [Allorhizocola rhizosphaerae]|uniref:hypothetical protein n=1 Tax=Allorhizocola rhizosphaerae TaxID=1872709 RepID=UPI000E3DDC49|nr:hypothetical protein [Allorhizocola rhizosphaerae]